jgi:membrane protease YdiL (CAAX protease family)
VYALGLLFLQLLAPFLASVVVVLTDPAVRSAVLGGTGAANLTQALTDALNRHMGLLMIMWVAMTACLYFILRGRRLVTTDITTTVPVGSRWPLLGKTVIVMLGIQAATSVVVWLISLTGFNVLSAMQNGVDPMRTTVPGILYIVVVGPFFEELIFRGAIMRHLMPYGVNFAIVTQALLFGLYHLNLGQSVFAFAAGLVFGYVAARFSLKWSFALHILNNAFSFVGGDIGQWIGLGLVIAGGLGLIALAILDRTSGRTLITEGRSSVLEHPFRAIWSQPLFVVMTVIMLTLCGLLMTISALGNH